jgi:hypothetical protein
MHALDLPVLDAATLTPVVREALESSTVEVVNWQASLIIHTGKAFP